MKNSFKLPLFLLISACTLSTQSSFCLSWDYDGDDEPHYVNTTEKQTANAALQEAFTGPHLVNLDSKFETFAQDTFNKEVINSKADYVIVFSSPFPLEAPAIEKFKSLADSSYRLTISGEEKLVKYIVMNDTLYRATLGHTFNDIIEASKLRPAIFIFKNGKFLCAGNAQDYFFFKNSIAIDTSEKARTKIIQMITRSLRLERGESLFCDQCDQYKMTQR